MKIYLASNNSHKYQEAKKILKEDALLLPSQEGINFSVIEDGSSFLQNAMIKAQELYKIVKCPVIADDSGLCVRSLNNAPGIFSARYSTPPTSAETQADYGINKLLKEMEGIENRSAFFLCCIVLYMEENRFFVFQETCEGEITKEKRGVGGFGYDPIFFIKEKGCTMAELSQEEKNAISHRGKAFNACRILLETKRIGY